VIWHNGRYWRYDGWAIRPQPDIASRKMQRIRNFPGYVQLTDESTGEVRRIRSDRVMVNAQPI
jgi:hypothetical protein